MTRLRPVLVIDSLEIIDVDHQAGQWQIVGLYPANWVSVDVEEEFGVEK